MMLEKGIYTMDSNQHPQDDGNPHKDPAAQLLQQYISGTAKCIYIYINFHSVPSLVTLVESKFSE